MSAAAIPRPHPKVVFREMSEGGVMLHLETGEYHNLNTTGSAIYKLIDGGRSTSDIAAAFRAMVDDPPNDVEEVVARFLDGLRKRDLIEG